MTYRISFSALTTSGEYVGTRHFTLETSYPLNVDGKYLCLERMCVEYARLTGLKCSFAQIYEVKEIK
jgi:hypothetical protein